MKSTTHSIFATSLTLAANHASEHISLLTYAHKNSPALQHAEPAQHVDNRRLNANQHPGTFYNASELQQHKLLH
ncbi:hypothetical protein GCM10027155_10540 [Acinetobacter apis]|uniref:Uncharacterized protein n=1 Tax=Acinetobacter apis TaxID=1229165 RepID=A0A217EFP2_9GAMM|nr:hypothetical protein [Acinetobacter apis]SNQ29132.1 hypothetical protein SAMN05444584_1066 [Acinetobacter apis]